MTDYYLSFGNIALSFSLPEEPVDFSDYDRFFTKKKECDFHFDVRYSDALRFIPAEKTVLCDDERETVTLCNDEYEVYYKSSHGGYFAVRCFRKNGKDIFVLLSDEVKGNLQMRFVLDTMGITELAAQKNAFVLHSSVIELDGKAVAFTGECGIGKSTQASLWNRHRSTPIINGDKAYVYLENNSVYVSGLPFCGSSKISENKALELHCIVSLSWANENHAQRASVSQALRYIVSSTYRSPVFTQELIEIINNTVLNADICTLSCTPDLGAVEALERYLYE